MACATTSPSASGATACAGDCDGGVVGCACGSAAGAVGVGCAWFCWLGLGAGVGGFWLGAGCGDCDCGFGCWFWFGDEAGAFGVCGGDEAGGFCGADCAADCPLTVGIHVTESSAAIRPETMREAKPWRMMRAERFVCLILSIAARSRAPSNLCDGFQPAP